MLSILIFKIFILVHVYAATRLHKPTCSQIDEIKSKLNKCGIYEHNLIFDNHDNCDFFYY